VCIGGIGVALAVKARLGAVWISFSAALTLLCFVNERQSSTARFLIPAFPLFVGATLVLPPQRRSLLIAGSAALMAVLCYMSATTTILTP
jgi:hypothetical protein